MVLEASQYNVEVEVTDTLILDDDIHETYEGFVIVLEIEQSDPAENITLSEYYSVLVIEICDNDGMYSSTFSCSCPKLFLMQVLH